MSNLGFFVFPPLEQSPVLQLSPAPGERDYFYHLDEREGLSDLYDLAPSNPP